MTIVTSESNQLSMPKWERDTEAIVSEYEREYLEMLRMIGKMTGLQRRLYPMEIQSPPISSIRH